MLIFSPKFVVFSRAPEEVVRMKTTTTKGPKEVARGQTISPRKPRRRRTRTSTSTRGRTTARSKSSCHQRPITEESTSEFSVSEENKVLIVCVCTLSQNVRPSGYLGSREIINYPRPTQQKPLPPIHKAFSHTIALSLLHISITFLW